MDEKETNGNDGRLRGFPVTFNVYARNSQEVEDLRLAVTAFISSHAREGRAVDAARLAKAIGSWDRNPLVRSRIIEYFR